MVKKGIKAKVKRAFHKVKRRVGRRGITIPIARTMAVGATVLVLGGRAIGGETGYRDVMGPIKAGNFQGAITNAGVNLRVATSPENLLPVVVPALITGFLGMGLDAFKANPTIKIGRFKVKAV